MTEKTDIIQRRTKLITQISTDTFNKQEFLTTHRITDRTLRRDLHALAEKGEIYEGKLNILRKMCLGKLTKKVAEEELSDSMMLQIVLSGVAQKIETKTDLIGSLNINNDVNKLIKFSQEEPEKDEG